MYNNVDQVVVKSLGFMVSAQPTVVPNVSKEASASVSNYNISYVWRHVSINNANICNVNVSQLM